MNTTSNTIYLGTDGGCPSVLVTTVDISDIGYHDNNAYNTVRATLSDGSGIAPGATFVATLSNVALGGFGDVSEMVGVSYNGIDLYVQTYSCPDGTSQQVNILVPTVYLLADCQSTNVLPPCVTNINFHVANNNPDWRLMGAGKSQSDANAHVQNVSPGSFYNYTWSGDCADASSVQLYMSMPGEDSLVPTGIPGTGVSPSGDGSNPPASTGGATNAPDVNGSTNSVNTATPVMGTPQSNILWSANSSGNTAAGIISTIKDAASVAHDDTVKESLQTDKDINNLSNALAHAGSNGTNIYNVTGGTNIFSLTNYALESTLESLTNGLFGAVNTNNWGADFLTNGFGVDSNSLSDLTNWSMGYTGNTNYDQFKSASDSMVAGTQLGNIENSISDWLTGFTDFSAGMDDTYPAQDMTYNFSYGRSSQVMNFDPLMYVGPDGSTPFVGIFAMCKKFFTYLIALAYLLRISEDGFKVVAVMANAHGINPAAIRAAQQKPGSPTN